MNVIAGGARGVADLLPQDARGRFGNVVCGIPLVLLPRARQAEFIGAMQQAAPGAGFLHYSDCITSRCQPRITDWRRNAWRGRR